MVADLAALRRRLLHSTILGAVGTVVRTAAALPVGQDGNAILALAGQHRPACREDAPSCSAACTMGTRYSNMELPTCSLARTLRFSVTPFIGRTFSLTSQLMKES